MTNITSRIPLLEQTASDLSFALRQMLRDPVFTLTIVLTVALGIGANTAMFSIIHAVLLKPLGYQDPSRPVLISGGVTPIRFEQMTASSQSYTGLGAYTRQR